MLFCFKLSRVLYIKIYNNNEIYNINISTINKICNYFLFLPPLRIFHLCMRACRDCLRVFVIYFIYIYIYTQENRGYINGIRRIHYFYRTQLLLGFLSCVGRPDTYVDSQIIFMGEPCNHSVAHRCVLVNVIPEKRLNGWRFRRFLF